MYPCMMPQRTDFKLSSVTLRVMWLLKHNFSWRIYWRRISHVTHPWAFHTKTLVVSEVCEYPREKLIPILPRLLCRVAMQHRSRYFTCILVAYVTHKSSLQLIRVTTAAEKFTAMRMLWRHVPIFGNPRYFRSNCCLCLSKLNVLCCNSVFPQQISPIA